jgi:hypothetical protein
MILDGNIVEIYQSFNSCLLIKLYFAYGSSRQCEGNKEFQSSIVFKWMAIMILAPDYHDSYALASRAEGVVVLDRPD